MLTLLYLLFAKRIFSKFGGDRGGKEKKKKKEMELIQNTC